MPGPTVTIVRTGSANLASVVAALRRCGARTVITEDREAVSCSRILVLPGVGAFGAVMQRLRRLGLVEVLRRRLLDGKPTLAICLGLQVMASGSEESPGVDGLGVLPTRVTRFGSGVRVPQLGWNRIEAGPGCALLKHGAAYFANSYRLTEAPSGWSPAWSDHGGRFVAALERGNVLLCQLHPELSGDWGRQLLTSWITRSTEAETRWEEVDRCSCPA